jgi:cytochrome c biogenesis protein CcdA
VRLHEADDNMDPITGFLAFSIGIISGFLPCCFVCYPGLFAFLSADDGEVPSRKMSALTCLTFAAGISLVGAIITAGLLSLGLVVLRGALGLGNVAANYAGWETLNPFNPVHTPVLAVVNYVGWGVLTLIGVVYLTGRSLSLPIPRVAVPQSLNGLRGYRGGFYYGVFVGGPGQAHCTVTILIPIVFLSLASLDPLTIALLYGLYTVGRIIPIFIAGLMLQDMRVRFAKSVMENSKFINRLVGVSFLIGGLVLLFWL